MSVTAEGLYGAYGGQYVPETLVPALEELERGWAAIRDDASFRGELGELQRTYVGRPTPLYRTERLAEGKAVYLKREDLCHTGAHKINNALGEPLGAVERRRAADVVALQALELEGEARVVSDLMPAALELVEGRDEGLGHVAAAVRAEVAGAHRGHLAASTKARTRS